MGAGRDVVHGFLRTVRGWPGEAGGIHAQHEHGEVFLEGYRGGVLREFTVRPHAVQAAD